MSRACLPVLVAFVLLAFTLEVHASVVGLEGDRMTWEGEMAPPLGSVGPAAVASDLAAAVAEGMVVSHNVLVLLVQFSDRTAVGSTEADWAASWFGAAGSVRDYYREVSYDHLYLAPASESFGTVDNGIIGWLQVGYNHPNTGSSTGIPNQQLTRDALIAADPYIDFSAYDADNNGAISSGELSVVVIAAGYERSYSGSYSPTVWGHRWSLSLVAAPVLDGVTVGGLITGGGYMQYGEWHQSISLDGHQATIGIMAHELGHDLGLPDLYDTDGGSEGIGEWGLMGSGSWGTAAGWQGNSPTHMCAWSKILLGFLTPTVVTEGTGLSLPDVATHDAVFRVNTSNPSQYFLIENRQAVGYDQGLPIDAGGVLIWHVDDSVGLFAFNNVNNDENHKRVDVEEAEDGEVGLSELDTETNRGDQADLFYSGNSTLFDDSTNPNANLYGGAYSEVAVSNVSAPGNPMTLDIYNNPPTDQDGDGFAPPQDCDDTDPNVYPNAPGEVAGDDIDTNCNGNDDCFIATAALGTEMAGKIDVLRAFRDTRLMTNAAGHGFVDAYYRLSPPVAEFITAHGWLRSLVRVLLLPVVGAASLLA